MKQHITAEQWKELKKKEQDKWNEERFCPTWLSKAPLYHLPVTIINPPDIGDMIEFLQRNDKAKLQLTLGLDGCEDYLCDSLWNDVKEVLEIKF